MNADELLGNRRDGVEHGRVLCFATLREGRLLLYPFEKERMYNIMMKKTVVSSLSLVLVLILALSVASCDLFDQGNDAPEGIWESATYKTDTELGEGSKTVYVEVKVEENTVTFTVHTDAEMLGEALLSNGLVSGEDSAYGLYIKTVNGILADYDVDQSYWAFYQNGEYAMNGVDSTPISGGEHFELVYTK